MKMTSMVAKGLTCAGVLSLSLFSSRAEAAIITIGPDSSISFEVVWSQMVGDTELSATGTFDVGVTDNYVDFLITLTNTTELWNERVHSIGFNTDPNGTSLTNTLAGAYFGEFALSTTFPGFRHIDVCAWSSQNCAGGRQTNNLPGLGTSDTLGFRLNGDFSGGVEVGTFAIQFMGDLGSYQFEGELPPTNSVPEPTSLLLVGIGIAGATTVRRRRAV